MEEVGVEEGSHVRAVECREATTVENVSRGVTFSFFDSMFSPLEGADPALDLPSGKDEEHDDFE